MLWSCYILTKAKQMNLQVKCDVADDHTYTLDVKYYCPSTAAELCHMICIDLSQVDAYTSRLESCKNDVWLYNHVAHVTVWYRYDTMYMHARHTIHPGSAKRQSYVCTLMSADR